MKKLIYIFIAMITLVACSKKDDECKPADLTIEIDSLDIKTYKADANIKGILKFFIYYRDNSGNTIDTIKIAIPVTEKIIYSINEIPINVKTIIISCDENAKGQCSSDNNGIKILGKSGVAFNVKYNDNKFEIKDFIYKPETDTNNLEKIYYHLKRK